ncbi:MAG: heparinase II/III family protein [Spirochaetes bacterium]|nr:heparinase II/III family protein [Spirochaetota bacterium]
MSGILAQIRTSTQDIFPAPIDGRTAGINPPPFCWLPVDGAAEYSVHIESADGGEKISERSNRTILLLRKPLPPGNYRWDLEANGMRRGWWYFSVATDAVVQIPPTADEVFAGIPQTHPRHFIGEGDIAGILAHHQCRLPALRENIRLALRNGLPPPPDFHLAPDRERQRLGYRNFFGLIRGYIDRDLVACALGHRLLGDTDAGAHAKRLLLTVCAWNPEGPCHIDGAWGDEIGLSMIRCLPAVNDWIADLLDEREMRFVKTTLAAYARQTYGRLCRSNFLAKPGQSHVGRLSGYLGEAAVMLHGFLEPAETREWMDYALTVYASLFPFFGGDDGSWAEGTFYATSYTKWYLPFFLLIERHTGFSFLERPFYRNLADFFLHFARAGWEIHPFCDGYWCTSDDAEWPGFFAQEPLRLYAERFGSPTVRSYLSRSDNMPQSYELHLLDVFAPPTYLKRSVHAHDSETPSDMVFHDAGVASMHTDIEADATDTAVLVRASRYGTGSHQHADNGSFCIVSRGKGLVTPSGYFGAAAATAHHKEWTHQTKAHNCAIIGGMGQEPFSHTAVGSFTRFDLSAVRGQTASVCSVDLSHAYTNVSRYNRHIVFIKPGILIVIDDIVPRDSSTLDWRIHTLSRPEVSNGIISVDRSPASMQCSLYVNHNLVTPEISDTFDVPVNHMVPDEFQVERPEQFHVSWHAASAASFFCVCIFGINRSLPSVHIDGKSVLVDGIRYALMDDSVVTG